MNYLDSLRDQLKLEPHVKDDLVKELRAHLEDRCLEMKEKGLSAQEAEKAATDLLGAPGAIAR